MVLAGLLLDHVQHWKVFKEVPELFILVPALLGLKGNLEMTLASRLSTAANLGILDNFANAKTIGNIQKLTFLTFFFARWRLIIHTRLILLTKKS